MGDSFSLQHQISVTNSSKGGIIPYISAHVPEASFMVAGDCDTGVFLSCGFQERKQIDDPVHSSKTPVPHFLQLSPTSQMIPSSGDQAFQSWSYRDISYSN